MTRSIEDCDLTRAPKSFKHKTRPTPRRQVLKTLIANDAPRESVDTPTFANIECTPSLLPAKKYCDITGLAAPYTDPKTRLRYCNGEVYDTVVKPMSVDAAQAYLALRNSQIVLK